MKHPDAGISRRELIRDASAAGAAVALAGPIAAQARPRRRGKRRVAVLGGGMAGLAAAHELAERGFKVTVFEPTAFGGKARSIPVNRTRTTGRLPKPLPGEHGFRFFPGFYRNVPDSMRRTPYPGNPNGVHDNLEDAMETSSPRTDGRADATLFGTLPDPAAATTPDGLQRLLVEELLKQRGQRPDEVEFFVNRLMVFLTSCDERRFGQWEHITWWDYVRADGKSDEYKKVIARGLTRSLVAAKETVASTRTIGNMAEAFVMNITQRGNDGWVDRVLNGPTNEVWIAPWVRHLRALGVQFERGYKVDSLKVRRGVIEAAVARDRRGNRHRIEADWFVCAMPAERVRRLWSRDILALDESLKEMDDLFVDWMVGIQYYLKRDVGMIRGHYTYVDSPWALTSLTQAQFWEDRDFARDYGDGEAVDCLSVDISDWDTPGILYGKPAKECRRGQIMREVWAQLKAHLEDTGESVLPDDVLHSWYLDPGVRWVPKRGRNRNRTPLLVNTAGSWEKRPTARTAIPNLFLAGDYVQTDIDLATMEAANESARAATNALLETAGSNAEPAQIFKLYDPPEFEAAKAADRELWKAGLPNALDRP